MHLYKSNILNSQNFKHINNKKKEIETILNNLKICKVNSTILNDMALNKKIIIDNSNILYDKIICNKLIILYLISKF